jgi:hypothetical protein
MPVVNAVLLENIGGSVALCVTRLFVQILDSYSHYKFLHIILHDLTDIATMDTAVLAFQYFQHFSMSSHLCASIRRGDGVFFLFCVYSL